MMAGGIHLPPEILHLNDIYDKVTFMIENLMEIFNIRVSTLYNRRYQVDTTREKVFFKFVQKDKGRKLKKIYCIS